MSEADLGHQPENRHVVLNVGKRRERRFRLINDRSTARCRMTQRSSLFVLAQQSRQS